MTTHERNGGQKVCFDVTGPGTVSRNCSKTNAKGQTTTTLTTSRSGCGSEGSSTEDSTTATIAGTEVKPRDEAGRAQTTVKINCPDSDSDTVAADSPQHAGSGSTTATATSAHNTSAVPSAATLDDIKVTAGGSTTSVSAEDITTAGSRSVFAYFLTVPKGQTESLEFDYSGPFAAPGGDTNSAGRRS